MMFCWCALVLLTVVPVITGNHAGVKVKLTQKGLDYVLTVAVNAIKKMLKTMTFPDIPVLKMRGLKIQSWENLDSVQKFDSTGVTITVNSANLHMTGNWASGQSDPFNLTLSRLDISATAAVKTEETGHLKISIEKCKVRTGHFRTNPNSRLVTVLSSTVLPFIADFMMCSMMKNTIDAYNTQLATLNAKLRGYAGVDFSMGPTVISSDSIEFSLKDIFFVLGQEEKTSPSPTDFTLPSQNTKMLYIGISAFTINLLVADFHKSGLLSIRIFDDMVPSWILTTTTFGAYIPEISEKYPDLKMMLEIQTAKEPVIKFEANNLVLEILTTLSAFVIQSHTEQSQLFVLNLQGSIRVQEYVSEQKRTLTLNKIEASIKETNIKTFTKVTKLNSFLEMVMNVAVFPVINAYLAKGYLLPGYLLPYSTGILHLVNTHIECIACVNTQGYLLIGTDAQLEENPSPEHN